MNSGNFFLEEFSNGSPRIMKFPAELYWPSADLWLNWLWFWPRNTDIFHWKACFKKPSLARKTYPISVTSQHICFFKPKSIWIEKVVYTYSTIIDPNSANEALGLENLIKNGAIIVLQWIKAKKYTLKRNRGSRCYKIKWHPLNKFTNLNTGNKTRNFVCSIVNTLQRSQCN